VGFAFIGGMVVVPFVGPWVERLRSDQRRRVARIIAAAERDGRVAR
jgi:hypothetical protein